MKVFADGAMYTKPAEWSNKPDHVVRTVGSPSMPSQSLIKYSLTTPGIHLAIIGIGHISEKDEECQLTHNLAAAQVMPNGLTETERTAIEEMAKKSKEGKTNYFQTAALPLTAPKEVSVEHKVENSIRKAAISWNTAYAGDAPIKTYEIWRDGAKIKEIAFAPQITVKPFIFSESLNDNVAHTYIMKVVDVKGRMAESAPVTLEKMG
jgi:hypothetical protein